MLGEMPMRCLPVRPSSRRCCCSEIPGPLDAVAHEQPRELRPLPLWRRDRHSGAVGYFSTFAGEPKAKFGSIHASETLEDAHTWLSNGTEAGASTA